MTSGQCSLLFVPCLPIQTRYPLPTWLLVTCLQKIRTCTNKKFERSYKNHYKMIKTRMNSLKNLRDRNRVNRRLNYYLKIADSIKKSHNI